MERKKCIIILNLLLFCLSFGQQLDTLLKEYTDLSQLYRQTRQESEGHLIIITREDIKKFQYHTLSDVLKSLRYFSLQRNQYGEKILSYATIYPLENSTVRIFINDHEISAVFRKTALPLWADLPLDFVEHIEIYQGESAIKFNNEAAGTIIKIYTKKPERENGGRIRAMLSSKYGNLFSFYSGWELPGSSAFSFFIGKSRQISQKYYNQGSDTRLDEKNYYGYVSFFIKGWFLESAVANKNSSRFRGDTLKKFPLSSDFENSHGYISIEKIVSKELGLKIRIYADRISSDTIENGEKTDPIIAVNPIEPVLFWNRNVESYKAGIDFYGQIKKGSNVLSYGGKIQKTGYRLTDMRDKKVIKDRNSEHYRSVFVEDVYNITPYLGIVGGVKYESMERKYGKDIDTTLWRMGLISLFSEKNYFKLFVSKYYTPPYFVEIYTNPDLKKQKNRSLTGEFSYKTQLGRFIFTAGFIKVHNSIMIDPVSYVYYNTDETLKYRFYSVDYIKKIGNFILKTDFFTVKVNKKSYKTAPSKGGFFKLGYLKDTVSFFVELIYREGYRFGNRYIKSGYDLTGGIKVQIIENGYIEFKGYNLLNKGLRTPAFKDPDFTYYLDDRKLTISFVKEF
ncbi:TonB-dependent receptor plug domain-containing protein [Persephonella sp.]|uniref:TonB-dependent receptor plug domain-containing protein n=1 Tax=Persephonella sp. TaxID=2060922 RepID=UPI0026012D96|nr:TonB-dependent receptor plug domain-containing protein [Persephonella sp.]